MVKSSPLFSVIIPTFNRKAFLKTAITSVLSQTYSNFELIIIDDGSSDGTQEFIQGFLDERIVYIYQKNQGVSVARNQGIHLAKGKWMAFLDSDDQWTVEKLGRTEEYIKKYLDIKIFHTQELWYRSGKLLHQKKKHKNPTGWVYEDVLPVCNISPSTVVIEKNIFKDIGVFDENFLVCEDYDFWLRATHKYEIKLIEECLTIKDGGRLDQLSARLCLDKYRIKALEKMLSLGVLNKEQYWLTYQALERKVKIFIQGLQKHGRCDEVKKYQDMLEQMMV